MGYVKLNRIIFLRVKIIHLIHSLCILNLDHWVDLLMIKWSNILSHLSPNNSIQPIIGPNLDCWSFIDQQSMILLFQTLLSLCKFLWSIQFHDRLQRLFLKPYTQTSIMLSILGSLYTHVVEFYINPNYLYTISWKIHVHCHMVII